MKDGTLKDRITTTVQRLLHEAQAPGTVMALLLDGQRVFEGSVGFRDPERTEPLSKDARFYIYSITKTMVAVAVLQLVEREALALDDLIQEYLPHLPLATPITLQQLLNHTGGLPDYGGLDAYTGALRAHPRHPWTASEFMQNTWQRELLFPPGEGWHYSNLGYLLLVQLLEKQYRRSLSAVLANEIFLPLGLSDTTVASSLEGVAQLTPGWTSYWNDDGRLEDIRWRYHPGWVAHGLVVSTAGELAYFLQALFDGRLLSTSLLERMREPHVVRVAHPLFRQPAYGLGLMLDPASPHGVAAGHGGGGPGYSTAALHFSDVDGQQVVSVALANRDHPDLGLQIAASVVNLLVKSSS